MSWWLQLLLIPVWLLIIAILIYIVYLISQFLFWILEKLFGGKVDKLLEKYGELTFPKSKPFNPWKKGRFKQKWE
jgi:hypothetical protein